MQQVAFTECTALNKGQVGLVKLLHTAVQHNTALEKKGGRNSASHQAHVGSSSSTVSAIAIAGNASH